MCDYSLENEQSRDAKAGDRLCVSKIGKSLSQGFCEHGLPDVAVCLLPGTELEFDSPVVLSWPWRLLQLFRPAAHMARFRQTELENPQTHHDSLELTNGQIVKLAFLKAGQRATVLQLPMRAIAEPRRAAGNHNSEAPAELV